MGGARKLPAPSLSKPELSWYFHAIRQAGMVVTMLDEPEPTAEFAARDSAAAAIIQIPMHIVIEARPAPAGWQA